MNGHRNMHQNRSRPNRQSTKTKFTIISFDHHHMLPAWTANLLPWSHPMPSWTVGSLQQPWINCICRWLSSCCIGVVDFPRTE
jgi:hypothetical protein